MFKHILVLFILGMISPGFSYAGTPEDETDSQFSLNDTTNNKKDSTARDKEEGKDDINENLHQLLEENNLAVSQIALNHLNPEAVSFVENYVQKFGPTLENVKNKEKVYLDMMDRVLEEQGIPKELKYLAVIESYLNPNARSRSGAVGAWQFMPTTARTMGLKVNHNTDERKNIYKSTLAACRYLTSLYSLYGNWLLVVAAYNSGPGYVNSAIKKSGSDDFWELQQYLPVQSRNHVKKFIATHFCMEGSGSMVTLTKKEAENFLMNQPEETGYTDIADSKKRTISGRYNASVIVKYLEMDLENFTKINPDFDKLIADYGKYELQLPANKMEIFIERKNEILNESVQLLINPGNTLAETNAESSQDR